MAVEPAAFAASTACRGRRLCTRNNHDVARRAGEDMACHAPEEQFLGYGLPALAHDDQIRCELLLFRRNHTRRIAQFDRIRDPTDIVTEVVDQTRDLLHGFLLFRFAVADVRIRRTGYPECPFEGNAKHMDDRDAGIGRDSPSHFNRGGGVAGKIDWHDDATIFCQRQILHDLHRSSAHAQQTFRCRADDQTAQNVRPVHAQGQQVGRFGRCDDLIEHTAGFNPDDGLNGNLSADD